MKKGVIYARYSSDRQNEQSIAGQVEVCTKWAEDNDIEITHIYHDEAISGKTDRRPNFQKMIADAKSKSFDYIVVYKLDRFARNRYDSAIYKAQLKRYNVRIISAMENIADGPEGIILESVLEGMAEYYSANLAQNVLRGMHQRAEQGKFLGGTAPLGYKIDKEKNFIIDEDTAFIVKRIFTMYVNGYKIKEIIQELNDSGYKTQKGKPFTYNVISKMLSNEKYIGKYEYFGITLYNAIPRIIDDDVFEKAQRQKNKNKHSPASSKGDTTFYLTGKLFCGKCGNNMTGDSGTSKTGKIHYYYTCSNRKHKRGCRKKTVRKDWLEKIITEVTINKVLTDENIEKISQDAFELYEKDRNDKTEINALNNSLRETQKTIDNIMNAIKQGIITETTKQSLLEMEEQKKILLDSIAKEEIEKPHITKKQIKHFLINIKNEVYNSEEQIETIINAFVNAVYLYDDKLIITFNLYENNKLKKIELSELEKFGFDEEQLTKAVLSEPLVFAIMIKLRSY